MTAPVDEVGDAGIIGAGKLDGLGGEKTASGEAMMQPGGIC
jgi:hypothetical protein